MTATCLGGQLREAFGKRRKSVKFCNEKIPERTERGSSAVLRECERTPICSRSRTEERSGALTEKSESLRFLHPRQSSKSISITDTLAPHDTAKERNNAINIISFPATEIAVKPTDRLTGRDVSEGPSPHQSSRQIHSLQRPSLRLMPHHHTASFRPLTPLLNSQAYQLNLQNNRNTNPPSETSPLFPRTPQSTGKSLLHSLVPRCHTVTAGCPTDKQYAGWNPFQPEQEHFTNPHRTPPLVEEESTGWPLKSVLPKDAPSEASGVPEVHRNGGSEKSLTMKLQSCHDLVANPALVAASWSAHDWKRIIQAAEVGIRFGESCGISQQDCKDIQQLLHQLSPSSSSASPSCSSSSSPTSSSSASPPSTSSSSPSSSSSTSDFNCSSRDDSTEDIQSSTTSSTASEHVSTPAEVHEVPEEPVSCLFPATVHFPMISTCSKKEPSLPSKGSPLLFKGSPLLGAKLTEAHRQTPNVLAKLPEDTPATSSGSISCVFKDPRKGDAAEKEAQAHCSGRVSRTTSIASEDSSVLRGAKDSFLLKGAKDTFLLRDSEDSYGIEQRESQDLRNVSQILRNAAAPSSGGYCEGGAPGVAPQGEGNELDNAQLMATILQAHDLLLEDQSPNGTAAASFLLEKLLELTQSEMGFIASFQVQPDGSSVLKTHAISNVGWTPELRQWYTDNQDSGLVYSNNEMPFGFVNIPSGATIINDAASSSCYQGVPAGHPEVTSFLAVPLFAGEELVGMYGTANRKLEQGLGGYSTALLENLKPLTRTVGSIIAEVKRRKAYSNAYSEYGTEMSSVIDDASEGGVDTLNVDVTRPPACRVSPSMTYDFYPGKSGFFFSNKKPLW